MSQVAASMISPPQTREVRKAYPLQMINQSNVPTPVNWQKLEHWLDGYLDDNKKNYRYGFKIGHPGMH